MWQIAAKDVSVCFPGRNRGVPKGKLLISPTPAREPGGGAGRRVLNALESPGVMNVSLLGESWKETTINGPRQPL